MLAGSSCCADLGAWSQVSLALEQHTQDGVVWGAWAFRRITQTRVATTMMPLKHVVAAGRLLARQLRIERRVRRTHPHVGAQVRPPLGNERATKQAKAAAPHHTHHKNGSDDVISSKR